MQENLKILLVIVLLPLFSIGCATVQRRDTAHLKVVPLAQLVDDPSQWEAIGKEINDGKTILFKVAQGQRLPLKLIMDIPVGRVERSENILTFNRDLYLLLTRTELEVSPDGHRWAPLGNMRSLKKLFGFRTGQMSVGFRATKDEGTLITLEVKAK